MLKANSHFFFLAWKLHFDGKGKGVHSEPPKPRFRPEYDLDHIKHVIGRMHKRNHTVVEQFEGHTYVETVETFTEHGEIEEVEAVSVNGSPWQVRGKSSKW